MQTQEITASCDDHIDSVCNSNRVQPYRFIHKGLRVLLIEAMQQAGSMDVSFDDERKQLVDVVERALSVCCDHLAHENQFFHEPLREAGARGVAQFYNDHLDHLQAIGELRLLLQRVRDAGTEGAALAYQLYLRFSTFVGENLEHMAEEETYLTRLLWDHFTDSEILGFEDALRSTFSPDESKFYLRWMAKGLNHGEVTGLLKNIRTHAPAFVYHDIYDTVVQELAGDRLNRVLTTMGATT